MFNFIKKMLKRKSGEEAKISSYVLDDGTPIMGAQVKLEKLKLSFKRDFSGDIEFLEVVGVYRLVDHPTITISVPIDEQDFFIQDDDPTYRSNKQVTPEG